MKFNDEEMKLVRSVVYHGEYDVSILKIEESEVSPFLIEELRDTKKRIVRSLRPKKIKEIYE